MAAHALSLLNTARIPLSGLDLSGIQAPGSYLERALLHYTDLEGAFLKGSNFSEAFLGNTNLKNSNLQEATFDLKN